MANVAPQRDAIESLLARVLGETAVRRGAYLDDGRPLHFCGVSEPRGIQFPQRVAVYSVADDADRVSEETTSSVARERCTAAVVIQRSTTSGDPLVVELLDLRLRTPELLVYRSSGVQAGYATVIGAAA